MVCSVQDDRWIDHLYEGVCPQYTGIPVIRLPYAAAEQCFRLSGSGFLRLNGYGTLLDPSAEGKESPCLVPVSFCLHDNVPVFTCHCFPWSSPTNLSYNFICLLECFPSSRIDTSVSSKVLGITR